MFKTVSALMVSATMADELCPENSFCGRYRDQVRHVSQKGTGSSVVYNVDDVSVRTEDNKVRFELDLANSLMATSQADVLDMELAFYQGGLMQARIHEQGADASKRFSISETGIGVEWSQLVQQQLSEENVVVQDDHVQIGPFGDDQVSYTVEFSPFRIRQTVNDELTQIINNEDSLYFEKSVTDFPTDAPQWDSHQAIGMGFFMNADNVYGIPERGFSFNLDDADMDDPYLLWNYDRAQPWGSKLSMYGAIPYLTAHSASRDSSVAWMNSAETAVQKISYSNDEVSGKHTSFSSEGNLFEFFVFGATSPRKNHKLLTELTGYIPMPNLPYLGFSFSKYEHFTAQDVIDRNSDFDAYGFPLDVLWLDIEHTQDHMYFVFNEQNFTAYDVARMNDAIEQSNRRIVAITDPHIKASEEYYVYNNGIALEDAEQPEGNVTNIFIRDPEAQAPWVGKCWPGESVWVDYLNVNAQHFWSSQYLFENFKGSSYIYGIWNDMNEPSVFKGSVEIEQLGMPKNNTHIREDGTVVEHRYVHNAYGALQQRATFRGVTARDSNQFRPYVLTRSFFFGSQRYGCMWTGDAFTQYPTIQESFNMLLTLGVSGITFGGTDVPGFMGEQPDDGMFVQFYQLGPFMPFFRAHGDPSSLNREPWLQTPRVQQAIRDAIYLRYQLIHYIYTLFHISRHDGLPLIRPMWYEFPEASDLFANDKQFMFGHSILNAPKINAPSDEELWTSFTHNVEVELPSGANWYSFNSKLEIPEEYYDVSKTLAVADQETATFVRGGSILPMLKIYGQETSLLNAINNPLVLDIYADNDGYAIGILYLDDGMTLEYDTLNAQTLVHFFMHDTTDVTVMKIDSDDNHYAASCGKTIAEVNIYGVENQPTNVVDVWFNRNASFIYNKSAKSVHVKDLHLPTDCGFHQGEEHNLLKLIY